MDLVTKLGMALAVVAIALALMALAFGSGSDEGCEKHIAGLSLSVSAEKQRELRKLGAYGESSDERERKVVCR